MQGFVGGIAHVISIIAGKEHVFTGQNKAGW
jgi:hypothetical protein